MDLVEIEWSGVDWIRLIQDRYRRRDLAYMVMNLKVP
jgi:hypothetical protein